MGPPRDEDHDPVHIYRLGSVDEGESRERSRHRD